MHFWPLYLGQRSDPGQTHMTGPGPVSGHPDNVWSKSVKACVQETVFCWCAKKERKN